MTSLTEDEQERLLADLQAFTGNSYSINEWGELEQQVEPVSSKMATDFLADLIGSDTTYASLVSKSPWFSFAETTFKDAKYGRVDPRSFNLGSELVHELYHASRGARDQIQGVFRRSSDWTGPVVDFVNKISAERGLQLRASYLLKPTMFGHRGEMGFTHVDPNKPDKIFYVSLHIQ